jgi:ABC-2 type transport system permease protein
MKAMRVIHVGRMVGKSDFEVFWANRKVWAVAWLVRVSTMAIAWVLFGRLLNSDETLFYLLIGNAVIVGVQSASFAVAASTWDRMEGTYPFLVISPVSLGPALIGRTSIWLSNAVASSLSTFAILAVLFRLPLPMPGALFAPAAVVIVCASSYSFYIFVGSIVIRLFQLRNIVANIWTILLTAFCGVSVPVVFWPDWIQAVAAIMPITHGLQAIRLLLAEGPPSAIAFRLFLEILIGASWLTIGLLTIDRMADGGRRDGSIDFV